MVVVGFEDKIEFIATNVDVQLYFRNIAELGVLIMENQNSTPPVVLLEFTGRSKNELSAQIAFIRGKIPLAKIAVVSVSLDVKVIGEALNQRVLAFISDATPIFKVLEIINRPDQVTILCARTSEALANHFTLNKSTTLTDRETEVLELLAQGLTFSKIADTLCIGIETVKTHVRHIYEKLDAKGKVHALEIARAHRLIA